MEDSIMAGKPIEIADIIRKFIEPYKQLFGHLMLPSHRRALDDILRCMTPAMGGGRYRCRDCDETFWSFHGCRNRSCPKCHGRQIIQWMEKRTAEVLPCDYFHVIATAPAGLRGHFLREQKLFYGIFMQAVASALCELARDKRYVGAVPAILAVLHTWTGRILHHPHVHLMVSGGGLSEDGTTWHPGACGFLVPVKKLSPMISHRFAQALKAKRPDLFARIPSKIWKKEWCSFCKHFGHGRSAVLSYLARYVFRIAITRNRIVTMDETHVTFRYKDNDTGSWNTERITGIEFIRRFLLHVLPKGFHKVRYYGLWSASNQSRHRSARILLQIAARHVDLQPSTLIADLAESALIESEGGSHTCILKCPRCKSVNVLLLERIPRGGAMVT
jgi:phage FluMu protein Com